MNATSCNNCRFVGLVIDPEPDAPRLRKLVCRRSPPIIYESLNALHSKWPDVQGTDWCGEHRPKYQEKEND